MENSGLNIKVSGAYFILLVSFRCKAGIFLWPWILSLVKGNNSDKKSRQMIKLKVRHNNVVSPMPLDAQQLKKGRIQRTLARIRIKFIGFNWLYMWRRLCYFFTGLCKCTWWWSTYRDPISHFHVLFPLLIGFPFFFPKTSLVFFKFSSLIPSLLIFPCSVFLFLKLRMCLLKLWP